MSEVHCYRDFEVHVKREELLRLLGRRKPAEGRRAPESPGGGGYAGSPGGGGQANVGFNNGKLRGLTDEAVTEAEALAQPRALLRVVDGGAFPDGSFLSSLFSRTPSPQGSGPVRAALSICTIGSPLEDKVTADSDSGRLARAMILDAAGSVLAEEVCNWANQRICELAAGEALFPGARMSPGYSSWNIKEQEIFFRLLPADSIGVTLTRAHMMVPRKSVSFAVALFEQDPGERLSPCARCGREGCHFRR
ncbi:MAG: vitamin B12 dependent-methionine synthase activation domain-containing protein [Candidatus Eisenbacteria bacterium]